MIAVKRHQAVAQSGALLLICFSLIACERSAQSNPPQTTAALAEPSTLVGPTPGPAVTAQPSSKPEQFDARTLQQGRRLFTAFNCSGCHGGRAGGGMAPSLRDELWLYGNSDEQIFDSIASGRANGMPAWGASLPESEIWKLVAYIQSLRTDAEPDAPSP